MSCYTVPNILNVMPFPPNFASRKNTHPLSITTFFLLRRKVFTSLLQMPTFVSLYRFTGYIQPYHKHFMAVTFYLSHPCIAHWVLKRYNIF